MALAEDAASVLEDFIQDVSNLPAEMAHLYEELQAKDKQLHECRMLIAERDNNLQRFIRANGSQTVNPREEGYSKTIMATFDRALTLQDEKMLLSEKAGMILDRQIRRLDHKIRELGRQGVMPKDLPPMPSLLHASGFVGADGGASCDLATPATGTGTSTPLNHGLSHNAPPATTTAHPNPSRLALAPPGGRALAGAGSGGNALFGKSRLGPAFTSANSAPTTPAATAVHLHLQQRQQRETSLGAASNGSGDATNPTKRRRLNGPLGANPAALALGRHSSLGPQAIASTKAGTTTTSAGSRGGSVGPRAGGVVSKKGGAAGAGAAAAAGGGARRKVAPHQQQQPPPATGTGTGPGVATVAGRAQKKIKGSAAAASRADSAVLPGKRNSTTKKSEGHGAAASSGSAAGLDGALDGSRSGPGPGPGPKRGKPTKKETKKKKTKSGGDDDDDDEEDDRDADHDGPDAAAHADEPDADGDDDDDEVDDDEEDEDDDDDDGGDDTRRYCTCRNVSYGNMVACDNERCPYEWFHWQCVGLTKEPAGTWFCAECTAKMGVSVGLNSGLGPVRPKKEEREEKEAGEVQ